MTAAARITQADMERAAMAVKKAQFERARIVMDLANHRIEVIIGEGSPDLSPVEPQVVPDQWEDDDV